MPRKSYKSNFGKPPEHLKDYVCDESEASDSSEDLENTVMANDDDNTEQTTEELLRQVVKQMADLQAEITKMKVEQLNSGAGTSKAKGTDAALGTPTAEFMNPTNVLNGNAMPFTVSSQDVFMQEFRRPLHDLPIFDGSIEQ